MRARGKGRDRGGGGEGMMSGKEKREDGKGEEK